MSGEEQNLSMHALVESLLQGLLRQGFDERNRIHWSMRWSTSRMSARKIYTELVRSLGESPEAFKDKLWDLREEFRHVAYHLKDPDLADL